ncbi:hypothetical protein WME73_17190 [Sorangium sp. So ce302]|uniref:hypothetical protein n=1 Tax=Sorangium sp. So ce302 TaxID=3133297 RepID=UPI003F5F7761
MVNLAPHCTAATAIPDELLGLPVVAAYGDPDDHLRLTALIGHHLRNARGVGVADAAATCLSPKASWCARQDALEHLLRHAKPRSGATYLGVLFDIDALDVGPLSPENRWDDRDFRLERDEFLARMLSSVDQSRWFVVRPRPSPDIDIALPSNDREGEPAPAFPELVDVNDRLAPECRPILDWLIRSGTLSVVDVRERFEAGEPASFDRHLISVAYNTLRGNSAETAKRWSSLRRARHLDDHSLPGPLVDRREAVVSDVIDETTPITSAAVAELRKRGFLQSGPLVDGSPTWRMPRSVRVFLRRHALASMPDRIGADHRTLAALSPAGAYAGLENQLEAHYHAVHVHPIREQDIDHAFATARHYVADLRAMAVRLSVVSEDYQNAARIFRRILDVDGTDAYAWEYFAYNLSKSYRNELPPEQDRALILEAYKNATEHARDRDNPLYHGRLLGFRARLGEDVRREFDQRMRLYIEYPSSTSAVGYFAEAVLNGVPAGPTRQAMIARWARQLEKNPRLAQFVKEAA